MNTYLQVGEWGGGEEDEHNTGTSIVSVRQQQHKKCIHCLNYFCICVTRGGGEGERWGVGMCIYITAREDM
jgi:hypothetical protein